MREVEVLLVTSPGCHFCDFARQVLTRLAADFPLSVSELPLFSPCGQELAQRDGIMFPPGIYVAGEFFGYGRVSGAKLRRRLEAIAQ